MPLNLSRFTIRLFASAVLPGLVMGGIAFGATFPRHGGGAILPLQEDVLTLNPSQRLNRSEALAASQLYETLLVPDGSQGRPLARAVPDGNTVLFTLSPDSRFWDGTPLTSQSVIGCWEKGVLQGTFGWLLEPFTGPGGRLKARVVSSWQFSLEADTETRKLLSRFTLLPLAIFKEQADPEVPPLGTGPFRVTVFTPSSVEMEAVESDPRGRPYLEHILAVRGSAGISPGFPGELLFRILTPRELPSNAWFPAPEAKRRVRFSSRRLYLLFPDAWMTPEMLNLRRAVALSVDRGGLKEIPSAGKLLPARSIQPGAPPVLNLTGGEGLPAFDVKTAQELFSKYPKVKAVLAVPQGEPLARLIAERLQATLLASGVRLHSEEYDASQPPSPEALVFASFQPVAPEIREEWFHWEMLAPYRDDPWFQGARSEAGDSAVFPANLELTLQKEVRAVPLLDEVVDAEANPHYFPFFKGTQDSGGYPLGGTWLLPEAVRAEEEP